MFRVNGGPNQRNKMFLNTGHCTAIKLKNHSIKLKLVSIITWINWTFSEIVYTGPLNSIRGVCTAAQKVSRPPAVSSSHLTQKCRPRTVPIIRILLRATSVSFDINCHPGRIFHRVRTRAIHFFLPFQRSFIFYINSSRYEERPLYAAAELLPQQTNIFSTQNIYTAQENIIEIMCLEKR